ncbi:MATE family efflux transporter [Puteibacter caeruleilacunae]|nr:MATE family efflux transporter [Puteibacter caeruleilacunae]
MKDFTQGNETNLILRFSAPMVLGSLFQNLYSIIDSIIVGNVIGKEALAAVAASFPIIFTLISLVIGVGSGASTVVSQYFGAKDYSSVKKTIDTIYIFFLIAGIIIAIIGNLFSEEIFRLLRLPEEVMPDALTYLNIYLLGMIFFFGFNGTTSVLRGMGDSKTPLRFMIIAVVNNIILDLLFIVVFKWGIAGAAWATIIAHAGAFISAALYLNRTHTIIRFRIRNINFDREIFKSCVRIGLPTGLQQSAVALGMMFIMGIVNSFGTNATAAYGVAMRIDSFAKMPAMTFSSALSSFVGQNLGAFKEDRAKKGFKSTLIISGVYCIIATILIVLTGEFLMRLFTPDEAVIQIGMDYLIIVSSFYILFSMMFSFYGVLRGAGATLIPMLITILSLWVIRIPLTEILSNKMGVNGIFWALPVSWLIGVVCAWIYYLKGNWKDNVIIPQPGNSK